MSGRPRRGASALRSRGRDPRGVRLARANLKSAACARRIWSRGLRECNLENADLEGANLEKANLAGANLAARPSRVRTSRARTFGRAPQPRDARYGEPRRRRSLGYHRDARGLRGVLPGRREVQEGRRDRRQLRPRQRRGGRLHRRDHERTRTSPRRRRAAPARTRAARQGRLHEGEPHERRLFSADARRANFAGQLDGAKLPAPSWGGRRTAVASIGAKAECRRERRGRRHEASPQDQLAGLLSVFGRRTREAQAKRYFGPGDVLATRRSSSARGRRFEIESLFDQCSNRARPRYGARRGEGGVLQGCQIKGRATSPSTASSSRRESPGTSA